MNTLKFRTLRVRPPIHAWLVRLAERWNLMYGGQPSPGKALEQLYRWHEYGMHDERKR
jgi:hypothetical protein